MPNDIHFEAIDVIFDDFVYKKKEKKKNIRGYLYIPDTTYLCDDSNYYVNCGRSRLEYIIAEYINILKFHRNIM